jgi:hypothetical protein
MSEAGTQGPVDAPGAAGDRSFARRVLGVLRLEGKAYDDVATDRAALGQAAVVVVAAALANAIGVSAASPTDRAVLAAFRVVALWPLLAAVLWAIANWFGHPIGFQPLLRVVGFAMAPLIVLFLLLVPIEWVQITASLLATALFFAAVVVGVREALHVEMGRAAFVSLVAYLLVILLALTSIYVASLAGGGA